MEENKTTTTNSGKGLCIAALVCGIVGLVLSFCGWFAIAGLILGIVAIVLSVLGKKQMPNGKDGRATAGLVCGIIAIVISVITVSCAACATCAANKIEDALTNGDYNLNLDDVDWDY